VNQSCAKNLENLSLGRSLMRHREMQVIRAVPATGQTVHPTENGGAPSRGNPPLFFLHQYRRVKFFSLNAPYIPFSVKNASVSLEGWTRNKGREGIRH